LMPMGCSAAQPLATECRPVGAEPTTPGTDQRRRRPPLDGPRFQAKFRGATAPCYTDDRLPQSGPVKASPPVLHDSVSVLIRVRLYSSVAAPVNRLRPHARRG